MRIIVIDEDHSLMNLLTKGAGYRLNTKIVLEHFCSPIPALERLRLVCAQVVVVASGPPGVDPVTLIREIKRYCPGTAISVIASVDPIFQCEAAFLAGACGFLTRPISEAEVKIAINSACNGLYTFSALAAQTLMRARMAARTAFTETKRLTEREVKALDLLACFLENKEIADQLKVSIPVLQKVVRSIFHKLGAQNRAAAIWLWKSAA